MRLSQKVVVQKKTFIGFFYDSNQQLWSHLLVFLHKKQRWLYVADEQTSQNVRAELKAFLSKGDVWTSKELGFREPVFRHDAAIQAIKTKIEGILADNNKSLTLFLEMSWAVRTPSGSIYLRNFISALQDWAANTPLSIVCLYNETILLEEQLLMGLQAHPAILTAKGVKDNPYYLPPDVFKNATSRTQFNYFLKQIDPTRTLKQDILPNSPPTTDSSEAEPIYHIDKDLHTRTAQSDEGRWKIRCLGDLKIYRNNGQLIDWHTKSGATKKVKTLFAYLFLKGEKGASLEELADLLWSDTLDMAQSANRLYHTIRCLREVLDGKDDNLRQSSFILYQNDRYYVSLPPDSWVDLPMFQELCFKGNDHLKHLNLEQALICYQSAERLYQGDFLTDIPQKYIENTEQDWCWSRRFWYRDMHYKLLHGTATIHRQMGNISEALSYCDKSLAIEPNSEPAHREKLLSLKAANRLDAVHRHYRLYCESMKKFDMGQPSKEMKDLYAKLVGS
jgi:DNA-binding SARP family transcriptional activator